VIFDLRFSILECGRLLTAALVAIGLVGFSRAETTPFPQSKIENRESKIPPSPLLWKIEGAGKKPSWLFGTIHLPRPDVAKIPPAVADAIAQSDAVYTEIPADMQSMLELVPRMMLPKGQTIQQVLGPRLTAELEAELKAIHPSLDLASLSTLKPWAVVASLTLLEDQMKYPGTLALDMVIFQRAAMAGKRVGGLEKPEEQVAAFEAFSEAEQILMVEETLAQLRRLRAQGTSVSDLLARLYLAGDLDRLVEELMALDESKDHPKLTAKFLDRLLYRRNAVMAERIAKKLRDEPDTSWFFAVGAGHLQGDRGLLADLAKAGFKLTRVP
jgi:uncharacterized protein YbaP (TraB family)